MAKKQYRDFVYGDGNDVSVDIDNEAEKEDTELVIGTIYETDEGPAMLVAVNERAALVLLESGQEIDLDCIDDAETYRPGSVITLTVN